MVNTIIVIQAYLNLVKLIKQEVLLEFDTKDVEKGHTSFYNIHRIHIGIDPADATGTEKHILSEFWRIRDEIKEDFSDFYKDEDTSENKFMIHLILLFPLLW